MPGGTICTRSKHVRPGMATSALSRCATAAPEGGQGGIWLFASQNSKSPFSYPVQVVAKALSQTCRHLLRWSAGSSSWPQASPAGSGHWPPCLSGTHTRSGAPLLPGRHTVTYQCQLVQSTDFQQPVLKESSAAAHRLRHACRDHACRDDACQSSQLLSQDEAQDKMSASWHASAR